MKLAGIADDQTSGARFRDAGKLQDGVQISNVCVALGIKVCQILSVDIERTLDRQIFPADVLIELNGMAGQVLEHHDAVVGRNQEGLTLFVEDLRPPWAR